jgi:hypothetical protein
MSDTGNGTLWTIDDGTKNVFDPAATFTVEVDSGGGFSTISPSNYTIRYLVGAVEFDSSQSGNSVRISGDYLPKYRVIEGYSTDPSASPDLLDATVFGDTAMRRVQGLLDVSVSFEQYLVKETPIDGSGGSESSLHDIVTAGDSIVFSWDPDGNGNGLIRAFVKSSSESWSASPDSLATRTLEMEVDTVDSAMTTQPSADADFLNT